MINGIQDVLSDMWEEACQKGRTISFKIISGSMSPYIEIGDTVKVCRVEPSRVHIGDIVAFKNSPYIIVHRIIGVTQTNGHFNFLLMGDAERVSQSIGVNDIIGKVVAINKKGREISLASPKEVISNKLLARRAMLIDYVNRGHHKGIGTGLKLLFKPIWRLCRNLLLWRSKIKS